MKRMIASVLALLTLLALPLPGRAANTAGPVIALTYCPAYGEDSLFEGVIFREDGTPVNGTDYRVTLYLQTSEGGATWIKPTFDHPYADPGEDGSFAICYVTGGIDDQAVALHFYLIPADFMPDNDMNRTKQNALDYVLVKRTAAGGLTVSPAREAVIPEETGKPSGLTVSADSIFLNVGFYTKGTPGNTLPVSQIGKQLAAIRPFSDTVRFYSAGGEVTKAYGIAKTLGFRVVGSAWLSGDDAADREELDALIELCSEGLCAVAVVGSETLLRGDLTPAELKAYMDYVREGIGDPTIPVTTADSADCLMETPMIRSTCDFLFVNVYPYWSGTAASDAAMGFTAKMEALRTSCPGKEIVCSETGWPTAGGSKGNAVPSEEAAAAYFEAVRAWSLQSGMPVFYFDAADEPWKRSAEGEVGAHWGILDEELNMKPAYAALAFFKKAAGQAGLGNFSKNRSYRTGLFRDVTAGSWFLENVQAVYEYGLMEGMGDGRFAPKNTLSAAEAVTLACRLHAAYRGFGIDFPAGEHWYDSYVAYAEAMELVYDGQIGDWTAPVTRRDAALMLAKALPESEFTALREGVVIPDVPSYAAGYGYLHRLYASGVLTGDENGRFNPEKTLTRAEAAAIMTRIVDPGLRK